MNKATIQFRLIFAQEFISSLHLHNIYCCSLSFSSQTEAYQRNFQNRFSGKRSLLRKNVILYFLLIAFAQNHPPWYCISSSVTPCISYAVFLFKSRWSCLLPSLGGSLVLYLLSELNALKVSEIEHQRKMFDRRPTAERNKSAFGIYHPLTKNETLIVFTKSSWKYDQCIGDIYPMKMSPNTK